MPYSLRSPVTEICRLYAVNWRRKWWRRVPVTWQMDHVNIFLCQAGHASQSGHDDCCAWIQYCLWFVRNYFMDFLCCQPVRAHFKLCKIALMWLKGVALYKPNVLWNLANHDNLSCHWRYPLGSLRYIFTYSSICIHHSCISIGRICSWNCLLLSCVTEWTLFNNT